MFRVSCTLFPFLILAGMLLAGDTDRGIELYQARNYKEAAAELQREVSQRPEDPNLHYYLGLSLLELERYREADGELKEANKLVTRLEESESTGAPGKDRIRVGLARAAMELKDYGGAQANLEEAARMNPENAEVPLYQGKLEIHRKNYAAAAKNLDKAVNMDPKQPYAHYYAGIAYSNIKRPDKMVEHFQMFLKLAPDAPEAAKVQSLLRGIR